MKIKEAPKVWWSVQHKRYPIHTWHVKATTAKDAIYQVLAYEPRLVAAQLTAERKHA